MITGVFSDCSFSCRLVKTEGERQWSIIARYFPGRIGKQCRERWHNQLRPDIKREAWVDAEEEVLIEAHSRLGNKSVPQLLTALSCCCLHKSPKYPQSLASRDISGPGRFQYNILLSSHCTISMHVDAGLRVHVPKSRCNVSLHFGYRIQQD